MTALCIFYPFSCQYYAVSPVFSYFCLFFFQNDDIWAQIMLVVLMSLYNIIIINLILKFTAPVAMGPAKRRWLNINDPNETPIFMNNMRNIHSNKSEENIFNNNYDYDENNCVGSSFSLSFMNKHQSFNNSFIEESTE
eukprot:276205_1